VAKNKLYCHVRVVWRKMLYALVMIGISQVPVAILLPTSVWFLCFGTVNHWLLLIWAKHQSVAVESGQSSAYVYSLSLSVLTAILQVNLG